MTTPVFPPEQHACACHHAIGCDLCDPEHLTHPIASPEDVREAAQVERIRWLEGELRAEQDAHAKTLRELGDRCPRETCVQERAARAEAEEAKRELATLQDSERKLDGVFNGITAERDALAADLAKVAKVIEERGCFEQDCTAPLDVRVDRLIVDTRSLEHWKATAEMRAADLAACKADNAALVGALKCVQATIPHQHCSSCNSMSMHANAMLEDHHPGALLLAELERLRNPLMRVTPAGVSLIDEGLLAAVGKAVEALERSHTGCRITLVPCNGCEALSTLRAVLPKTEGVELP